MSNPDHYLNRCRDLVERGRRAGLTDESIRHTAQTEAAREAEAASHDQLEQEIVFDAFRRCLERFLGPRNLLSDEPDEPGWRYWRTATNHD